ncbi:MAG: MgtC/SapB family protein [Acetilactobacillus jinshanensis]
MVAIGAALTTLVSKYGFYDILALHNISLDPSRIAAQIISGIGFIGAGMILTGRTKVSGLTTAAGIWATAAIGMTVGAGLYIIGIAATVIIVAIQFMFHDDSLSDWLVNNVSVRLQIRAVNKSDTLDQIKAILKKNQIGDPELEVVSVNENHMLLQAEGMMNHRKTSVSKIILDLNKEGSNME